VTASLPTLALPRPAWAALGFAALAAAVAMIGPWAFALWLLPDLALVLGGRSAFADDGRLAPHAVGLYNAAHSLPGPLALGAAALLAPAALPFAVLWLSHIALDRSLGYGLRAADGSLRA
jgi:hypothetical protein